MPNHVSQRLTFTGPAHVIAAMLAAIRTDHPAEHMTGGFDDEAKVYTKPNPEDEDKAPIGWLHKDGTFKTRAFSKEAGKWVDANHAAMPEGWVPKIEPAWSQLIDFHKIIPAPPCVVQGSISFNDEAKHPNRNWYQWNSERWGTKWNAYATKMDEAGRLCLETAWALPKPVYEALSWLFPEVSIAVEFVDEGWCFWGQGRLRGGEWEAIDTREGAAGVDSKTDPLLIRLEKELRGHDITKEEEAEV